MSFRNRLALFFVLIVIVPLCAVALLVNGLITKSAEGQIDAAISAHSDDAVRLLNRRSELAETAIRSELPDDQAFGAALRAGDIAAAERHAARLLRERSLDRIVFVEDGAVVFSVGDRTAVAPAVVDVQGAAGGPVIGTLEVSTTSAAGFARSLKDDTSLDIVIRNGGRVLASTRPELAERSLPEGRAVIELDGQPYRVRSFKPAQSFTGQQIRVYALGLRDGRPLDDVGAERRFAALLLLGFLVVALACAVLVSRSLQQQIASFLMAARKLAGGDFSAKVPTTGNDEFAELGQEFNKMSVELERRLVELTQERVRVQDSVRRLGEAVASNLDRDALLELVVSTAVDGVGADTGRASVRAADRLTLEERSRVGDMNGLESVIGDVEIDVLRSGGPREASVGASNAIAYPLRGAGGDEVVGVVSIGRSGRPFTRSDRDLFSYLAGQAGRSLENVQLHETATRDSLTDDLTGLSNRRAFDDALSSEIVRVKRFGSGLGLVLIDLDDFKSINDTYGHQQGDVILREVGRILRETSREIDVAARYGGEELAVVLPGTDLEGAYNVAERVRMQISTLRVPRIDGAGAISVTTSCGVAATPPTATEERAVVAAADAALYEAKRSGKNKSVRGR